MSNLFSSFKHQRIGMFKPKEKKKSYNYFDTPDGEDVWKKLWAVLKPTTLVALGASTADVLLYSHPKGYLKTLQRFAIVSVPIFGVASAFVIGTNMAARVRNKDDKLNWFIGGATAGTVLGAWCKSPVGAVFGGLALGLAAVGKKAAIDSNFTLIPIDIKKKESGIRYHDFSLIGERPGNWLREEELDLTALAREDDKTDVDDEEDEECEDDEDEWEDEEEEEDD